jgi:hypothetical protein
VGDGSQGGRIQQLLGQEVVWWELVEASESKRNLLSMDLRVMLLNLRQREFSSIRDPFQWIRCQAQIRCIQEMAYDA